MARNDSVINIGANADQFNNTLGEIRKQYESSMKALEGDTSQAAESARKSLQKAFDKQVQDSFKSRWNTNSEEIRKDAEEVGKEISGWFKVTAISTGFLAIKDGFQSVLGLAQSFGQLLDRGAELERVGIVLKQAFGDAFNAERADAFVNRIRSISGIDEGTINQELARFGQSGYNQDQSERLLQLALDAGAGTQKELADIGKIVREVSQGDLGQIREILGYQLEATGDLRLDSEAGLKALEDKFKGLADKTAEGNLTFESLLGWARDEFAQGIFAELKGDLAGWKDDLAQYLSSDQFKSDIRLLVSATGVIAKGIAGAVRGVGSLGEMVVGGVLGQTGYLQLQFYNTQREIMEKFPAAAKTPMVDGGNSAIDKEASRDKATVAKATTDYTTKGIGGSAARAKSATAATESSNNELGKHVKDTASTMVEMYKAYQDALQKERDRREREAERYADQLERERDRALKLAVQQPINLNVFGNSTSRLSYARGF